MAVSLPITELWFLALALHAGLIGAAAGAPLWRALPEKADNIEIRTLFALAIGLALDIAAIFVFGLFGLLRADALLAAGAAATLAAGLRLRNSASAAFARLSAAEIAIAASFFVWVVAAAIKPPGMSDDTLYHLPLARFYAQSHGLGLDPFARFPLFPQNMEMLFALALAVRPGDALLAQALAALPAFAVAIGLVGALRWLRGSTVAGVAAGAIFLGLPSIAGTLGYAYIDHGLALFCFALALGVVLFRDRAPLAVYGLLGLIAGTAGGCKIHGLILVALSFASLGLFRARLPALAAFALTAALFGCGWYVRSFVISGDPLSPAGGPWFGYFLWDADDLAGQKAELATHGVGSAFWLLPQALIKGGASWLLPGLLAPLAARRDRVPVLTLWAIFLAYAIAWFRLSQVDRYLAPVAGIGALLTILFVLDLLDALGARFAPAAHAWFRRPEIAIVAATALLAIFVNGALADADRQARGFGRILAQRTGYSAMQAANAAAPRYGSRLVQVGFEGARYFYDGVMIGDWFGPGRYRQFWRGPNLRLVSSSDMREKLKHFDAKLLALNLKVVAFDERDYRDNFDILLQDSGQALLALKDRE